VSSDASSPPAAPPEEPLEGAIPAGSPEVLLPEEAREPDVPDSPVESLSVAESEELPEEPETLFPLDDPADCPGFDPDVVTLLPPAWVGPQPPWAASRQAAAKDATTRPVFLALVA